MGRKKYPFFEELRQLAVSSPDDVAMERVKPGRLYCIQHVTVENETTDFTSFRILKAGVGGEHPLVEQLDPEADELYWMSDDIYLTEGQYLLVRFVGCTADDVLKVYYTGWWQEGVILDG